MGMNPALTLLAASGGAAAWTPASLPNLIEWWDAGDTASITSSGGKVSAWVGQEGAYTLIQNTGDPARPTTGANTINGLNVLDFDGGDSLFVASFDMSAVSAFYHWAIFTAASGGDQVIVEHSTNFNSNTGFIMYRQASNKTAWGTRGSGASTVTASENTGTLTTTAKLVSVQTNLADNPDHVGMYLDGSSDINRFSAFNSSGTFASTTLYVGARAGTSVFLTGKLATIGFASGVLSADDRTALHNWAQTRWGTA